MRDRHVLITGGGGGLGLDVTAEIVAQGARVTATTYRAGESKALRERCPDCEDRVELVQADLRNEAEVRTLVDSMPRLDALVHLVGGFAMGDTAEFSLADFEQQVQMNLTTTFLTVRAVLPRMREAAYGRIVTVASRVALEPAAQMAAYSATKAAVLAFTKAVAEECRGTGITANAVLPSVIDTPNNRAAMGDADADRWVKPQSLGKIIAFLASESAGDLRGTAAQAYGGV